MKSLGLVGLLIVAGCDDKSNVAPKPEATAAPVASAAPSVEVDASPPVKEDPLSAVLGQGAVVREEHTVMVDGVKESWRLEWARPPVPDCVADTWSSCACAGFAFGEKGDLDLVRSRPGAADERMRLDGLFNDGDSRLRRWRSNKGDEGKKPNIADLSMRPVDTVMKLADYDHDGRATEFVLQVEAAACGHTPSELVGISKSNPKLHAFSSKEKANEPLQLDHPADWERLLGKPSIDVVQVACGDHGAELATSLVLSADGELHAKVTSKPCP